MNAIHSISEIVETFEDQGHSWEVCAEAESHYDDRDSRLDVQLRAFLRPVDSHETTERLPSSKWLPPDSTQQEHVGREEAGDVSRLVFQSWVKKVRQAFDSRDTAASQ